MKLKTKHFGEIDIEEPGIIEFSEGLPGFSDKKKFVILAPGEEGSPFKWLQSAEDAALAFAVADIFQIKPDYDIEISNDTVEILGINKLEDVLVYSIVVIPEDISEMSMNLKAPVIINKKNMKGMQVVLDTERYGVRHYIQDELRKQEVSGHAGADKEERAVHSCK